MKNLKGQGVSISGDANRAAETCLTGSCWYQQADIGWVQGVCQTNSKGRCVCNAGTSSIFACAVSA